MKELEKLIPKRCPGVSPMLVKELVTTMIDEDGVISVEKCGQINIYWCFKNQVIMKLYESICKLRSKIQETRKEIELLKFEINKQVKHEKCPKFSSDGVKYDRNTLLQELDDLKAQIKQRTKEYNKIEGLCWDDDKIKAKQEEISRQIHNLDVITDNIEILICSLAKRCSVDVFTIKTELEIPHEFEEIHNKLRS